VKKRGRETCSKKVRKISKWHIAANWSIHERQWLETRGNRL